MSRDFLPKLFDSFNQEDSSSTNRYGSTGLGMAITKSFIELMNGTISVESEQHKGTTFTVTVTLMDCDHKSDAEEKNDPHPEKMSGPAGETAIFEGRRILLAEDVPVNAFDEDVQRSMQAGLNAHLSKPVEPDILFETLEGLLRH